jgi:hypothetical protein
MQSPYDPPPNEQQPWEQPPPAPPPSTPPLPDPARPSPPPVHNAPPPGYGYQPVAPAAKPVNGTLLLAMGAFGIMCCHILGPVTWIMANNALNVLNYGGGDESQRQHVEAARVLGMIATALIGLALVGGVIGFFWAIFEAINSPSPSASVSTSPVPQ